MSGWVTMSSLVEVLSVDQAYELRDAVVYKRFNSWFAGIAHHAELEDASSIKQASSSLL